MEAGPSNVLRNPSEVSFETIEGNCNGTPGFWHICQTSSLRSVLFTQSTRHPEYQQVHIVHKRRDLTPNEEDEIQRRGYMEFYNRKPIEEQSSWYFKVWTFTLERNMPGSFEGSSAVPSQPPPEIGAPGTYPRPPLDDQPQAFGLSRQPSAVQQGPLLPDYPVEPPVEPRAPSEPRMEVRIGEVEDAQMEIARMRSLLEARDLEINNLRKSLLKSPVKTESISSRVRGKRPEQSVPKPPPPPQMPLPPRMAQPQPQYTIPPPPMPMWQGI